MDRSLPFNAPDSNRDGEVKMTPKVLIVDDEELLRMLYGQFLKRLGCWCVLAVDAEQARNRLTEHEFALALVDVNMPGTTGLELVRYITREHPNTAVLIVTAVDDPLIADSVLEMGASGYLIKPFECNELLINVSNALRRRTLELQRQEHRERLEQLIAGGLTPFASALDGLKKSAGCARGDDERTIMQIARTAEFHDREPGQHIERMSGYCALMARRLGMDADYIERIRLASMLHDLGKISIPDSILFKAGRLTSFEMEVMRRHAQFGHHMLMGTNCELLELAASIAWTHHERYGGTGYPRGLAGENIPIEGRIAAVADVFDALTSETVYRPGYPREKAIDIMLDCRGQHFDPTLVDLFLESIRLRLTEPIADSHLVEHWSQIIVR